MDCKRCDSANAASPGSPQLRPLHLLYAIGSISEQQASRWHRKCQQSRASYFPRRAGKPLHQGSHPSRSITSLVRNHSPPHLPSYSLRQPKASVTPHPSRLAMPSMHRSSTTASPPSALSLPPLPAPATTTSTPSNSCNASEMKGSPKANRAP